ncbi:MAG: transcription antitermination factor NusB [Rhodocyclaceae bacterium]|nr:transcription antitermination factor NusB [Rhodocyclaceae bacterium]
MSNPKARRKAREFAVQGIYQWLVAGNDIAPIEEHVAQSPDFDEADGSFFRERLRGAIANAAAHDAEIGRHIERRVSELSPVEHAVLLLAGQELAHHPEVPYRVVINEAIELTKAFGGSEGHRFVNGVLDRMAAAIRATEVEAARRKRAK